MSGLSVVSRLWRDRLTTAAAAVLVVCVVASTLLHTGQQIALSQTLSSNWRGAYDILVRPSSETWDASATGGFVEGNFVSFSGTAGISLDQLERIRRLDGVAVAAPIGLVGRVGYAQAAPLLNIPDNPAERTSALPAQPSLYRLTYTLTLTDAGGTRVVNSAQTNLAARRFTAAKPNGAPAVTVAADGPFASGGNGTPGLGTTFQGPTLPAFSSSIIAVDPVAERELLGAKGAFLEPLTSVPSGAPRTAGGLAGFLASAPDRFWSSISRVADAANTPGAERTPVVPMVVNSTPSATLTQSIAVEKATNKVASPFPESVTAVRDLAKGATFVPLGISTLNLSDLLVPFATGHLELPWPGTPGFTTGADYTMAQSVITPVLATRPTYAATPGGPVGTEPAFQVQPQGIVSIDGSPLAANADLPVAGVQSYRELMPTPDANKRDPLAATPLMAPFASFDQQQVSPDTSGVSYVPFGAYDPASTTLVGDSSGTPVPPQQVVANPSGRDFISPVPGAITDLQGGAVLRGSSPIDAVRIRVAGISDYSADSQARVTRIAGEVSALGGLTVTVVAGASPQPVQIFVPAYRVDAGNNAADLGWVRQDWTTLGAAVQVERSLSTLSVLLLALALLVGALLTVGASIAAGRDRSAQAIVLRQMGWTRRQILNWQFRPQLILLCLVALTAVLSVLGAGGRVTTWVPAVLAITVAAGGVGLAGWRTTRPSSTPSAPRVARPITSVWSVVRRRLFARPGVMTTRIGSWALTSAAVGAAVVAISDAADRAGATRLAGLAVTTASVANLVFAILIGVSGIMLGLVIDRIDGRGRADEDAALLRAGWLPRQIRGLTLRGILITAIPSGALAVAGAALLASWAAGPVLLAALAAAATWLGQLVIRGVASRTIRARDTGET